MVTLLLGLLIFGSASYIVYSHIKSGRTCGECKCACPVKQIQKNYKRTSEK
ncbi:FeoB-associated Cys-rich membrane protein [Enterococcus ratti]|uniref:FeoB-associated Cys-rich membrane protein n=1 Tax=Enterococcus ratti TaxID=150033 RepID=UPI0011607255|nr:FeoB-associated Cys-rich membrane protein [Enterococcus ratti]